MNKAARDQCWETMEYELDEAIALLVEQPIQYRVPDYDLSKPSVRAFLNAAIEGGDWSTAPDFNGE